MSFIISALLLTQCLVLDSDKWSSTIPEPLRRAFEYRMKPRTGYIKFQVTTTEPELPKRSSVYETRFAGGNIYLDEESSGGVVMVMPNAPPGVKTSNETPRCRFYTVFESEKQCQYFRNEYSNTIRLRSMPGEVMVLDIRSFGILPGRHVWRSTQEIIEQIKQTPMKYIVKEQNDKGLRVLGRSDADEDGSTWEREWILDPEKDFAILNVELRYLSRRPENCGSCTTKVEVVHADGYWWPNRIDSTSSDGGFHEIVEVLSMEFDRPNHPEKINLDTLESPVGAKVQEQVGYGEEAFFRQYQYLGNNQLLRIEDWKVPGKVRSPHMDFESLKKRATTRPDGTWVVESLEIVPKVVPPPKIGVSGNPDEWEAFVQLWITRHGDNELFKVKQPLDEKQKNAAMAILQESRPPAWNLVRRRKMELEFARKRLEEKGAAQNDKTPNLECQAGIDSIKTRLNELEAPDPEVEAIFARLKSRLHDLLTAQQKDVTNIIGNRAKPPRATSQPQP